MNPARVTVVGLGKMGRGVALHLASVGHDVIGFDTDEARRKGLPFVCAETLAAAVSAAKIVVLSLPRAEDSEVVVTDLIRLRLAGHLDADCVLDMGTSLPSVQRSMAERLAGVGIGFVDAPVSGGPSAAESGQLLIMVGGTSESVAHVAELLDQLGRKVAYMGSTGTGTVVKLLNNGLVGATICALGEAVRIASESEISAEALLRVLSEGSARSYVVTDIASMEGPEDGPRFTFGQLLKDVRYLNESISGLALDDSLYPTVERRLSSLVQRGFAEADFGAVWPFVT